VRTEAAEFIARAHEDLSDARSIAGINLPKVAARSAYYAAFHAAEALIFEKSGKSIKTHRGVRTEFARLTKDDPRTSGEIASFLGYAYQFKEISDYGTDATKTIAMPDAEAAITLAEEFVRWVGAALA
jgi:uncharacterized protein (UPF0332 family)